MKNVISGWVLILDMYYYRKNLITRYNRIKYYQRNRSIKVDSSGFIGHVSSSLSSVYKYFFKSRNKYRYSSLNEAIKKQLERNDNRRLFIEARVKNKDHNEVMRDFINYVGERNYGNWKDMNEKNTDHLKPISTTYNRVHPVVSCYPNVPEIGVDKELINELESKMNAHRAFN